MDSVRGGLELRDVTFTLAYNGQTVIQNLSLHVFLLVRLSRSSVPTGSGKSTLVESLLSCTGDSNGTIQAPVVIP